MDKSYIEKFEKVLIEEDSVLDTILIKQKELHDSISNKNWTDLMSLISDINLLSDNFQKLEQLRETMQSEIPVEELHVYFDKLGSMRSKLTKSKVENQALSKYLSITRGFVQGVIDTVIPQNKVYTKKGVVQSQPQSVVLNELF